MTTTGAATSAHCHRARRQDVEEVVRPTDRDTGRLEARQVRSCFFEQHCGFEPSQPGAEAEVRTTCAEGVVAVGITGDVEVIRVAECLLVAVRRHHPQSGPLAGPYHLPVDLDVVQRPAGMMQDRWRKAEHLLHHR